MTKFPFPILLFHPNPRTISPLRKAHYSPNKPNPATPSVLSPVAATNLIKSLCAQGSPALARRMFDEMPERDVVAWTAMISGYASNGRHEDAWATFRQMTADGVGPNEYTVSSVLTSCKGLGWRRGGAVVHAVAVRRGVDRGTYVENALLDVYASCGGGSDDDGMDEARKAFEEMAERTAVSWTTMVAGYTHRGDGYAGVLVFRRMVQEGAELNPFTCSIAIRACASIGSLTLGKQLHVMVEKSGHGFNLPVANSLVDMYCRCMSLAEARRYFNEMPQRDLITWNAMIAGLQRYNSQEALQLFLEIGSEDLQPNCFTFTSILSACADLAVLHCGQQVHGAIVRRGFTGNLQMANALVDMYAKCGSIADSREIFSEMNQKDLISWTSMMIGYGINGYGKEAMDLFDEMINLGIQPDHVVFMVVISACSHAGLVDEGLKYFDAMRTGYDIPPNSEVYGCVIDLLGRAGRLMEAYELIKEMTFEADESIWGALLGASRMHNNVGLGRLAAQKIMDLKPEETKTYVLLSNIYAAGSEWGEFAETRRLLRGMGSKKEAGMSWIEVRNKVCSFVAGDRSNPYVDLVYEILEMLVQHMTEVECDYNSDGLLHDLEEVT
ncbi:putative pentatricopeptide repeat-containing protein At1g56570 [Phoenix dactylifera]|uniref:Pentatricopeptide repeat-containing protein At1g56570 n=1 Tax=Phoenix dactylifera TaxID=42345 RepID=A0A8B7CQM4_PHODC|nr:putative pentatricopeptide repeat-containing protein At1g56570 [Phoenix dactylifera]